MPILDTVEHSLKTFRPKTHRQFAVFYIARRFNDLSNLARYLNICSLHPKKELLEAARLAEQRCMESGRPPIEPFFELLEEWRRREET
jgi:hypothetical protein